MSQKTKLRLALTLLALTAAIFAAQFLLPERHRKPDPALEAQQQAIVNQMKETEAPEPPPPPGLDPADTSRHPRKAPR